jgi:NAD(P)-dependent dehydrogenase (short-subunit alcohol dehydrogenase family)
MASKGIAKDFSLEGKGALIIGAENVAGRAAAVTLAEAGAKVMIASQEPGTDSQLQQTADAVKAAGQTSSTRVQNSALRSDVSATVAEAAKQLGHLDILVNAIDVPWYGDAESADEATYERVIGGNLRRVWIACQEGGRVMLQQGSGVIVNITSVLADRGVPNASLYCAAKAGAMNLTRALALEWARKGVRINALESGWMEEAASPTNANEDFKKILLKYLPSNRLVKPEELGGALLYLVSPAAGFVTGESIVVDGGLMCRV